MFPLVWLSEEKGQTEHRSSCYKPSKNREEMERKQPFLSFREENGFRSDFHAKHEAKLLKCDLFRRTEVTSTMLLFLRQHFT